MAKSSLAQGSGSPSPRRRRRPRKTSNKRNMTPRGTHNNSAGDCVSGAQLAASNQTLNFMLGNRRQPSWMTAQQPPASAGLQRNMAPVPSNRQAAHGLPRTLPSRPPSRSSSNNTPGANRPASRRVTPATSRPTNGPLDKLAALPELNQQTFDCAAALPSPAPTDQPSPPPVTSNQNRDTCVQSPDWDHDHLSNAASNTPASISEAFTQERTAVCLEKISGLDPGPAISGLSNNALSPEHDHSTLRLSVSEPSDNRTLLAPSDSFQTRSSGLVSAVQSPTSLPTPGFATVVVPRRQSSQTATSPSLNGQQATPGHHTPQHLGQSNNGSRQTVELPEPITHPLESFRPEVMTENLDSFIRLCGGIDKLPDDGTSVPRIRLLKDAIGAGDYFYIVLHQILCVWSVDREAAYRLLGLAPVVAESALSVIQNTLRKNENMTQDLVHFFADFPNSRVSGLWETETFRKYASDVSVFLNNLHEQWNRIHVPAMRPGSGRGYPILADELHYQLKLRSPLLESIFFTVTRRHIGVPDGPIADQMSALFRQDSHNDHSKSSEQEQRAFQHALISRYKQLVHQNERIQQQQQQQQQPRQQNHPSLATRTPQPLPHNMIRPQAVPRQQTMIEQVTRPSASFSPTQTRVLTPTQTSPAMGFDMYPSPAVQTPSRFQSNLQDTVLRPPQLMLRSHNSNQFNGGIQQSMQQGPMRMPQMVGQMNQPLTPAGSPHHPNMQLPYAARASQALGQTSRVLQAPPGGLSVSMPAVTSPTQSMAPQSIQGQSLGIPQDPQLPQLRPPQPRGFQQAPNANPDAMRQMVQQGYQQRQVQAIAQRQLGSSMSPQALQLPSPRLQQTHQIPSQGRSPLNVTSHLQLNPNLPGPTPGVANHLVSGPQTTRPRICRDESGRLRGNVFAPPNIQIPLDRLPHTPWEPKALRMALHQVEVRSPRRVPRDLPRADDPATPQRYYQSIKELAFGPIATPAKQALHRLVFVVSDEEHGMLCLNRTLAGDGIPVSEYFNGSLRYRLRLCELPVNPEDPMKVSESTWAVAPSYWPDHINIVVNGTVMTIRRKQHNGQHLPVELTPFIFAGKNSISVAISPSPRPQTPNMMYYMAVEVIETLSHEHILNMVLHNGAISADSTRETIQNRLKPVAENGDDELAVVGDDLSIDLADPFSATIFRVPVRGASCTHMECFDLATWLQTRPAKPRCTIHGAGDDCHLCDRGLKMKLEPSLVDKWKCPLCDGDARPCSLRKDNFMAEVRSILEMEGKLDTKTIYVAADGSWRAKVEEADDEDDEDEEDGQPPAKRVKTRTTAPEAVNAVEIIELD